MARRNKPYRYQGWWQSSINGKRTRICPDTDSFEWACRCLEEIKSGKRVPPGQTRGGNPSDAPALTVSALVEDYLRDQYQTRARDNYRRELSYTKYLVEWYGHRGASSLSLRDGEQFRQRLQELGTLQASGINHHLRRARSVFLRATRLGLLRGDPWALLERFHEDYSWRLVSDHEFRLLLEAAKGAKTDYSAWLMDNILRVLRDTAMRPEELVKLRWEHYHPDRKEFILPAAQRKSARRMKQPGLRVIALVDPDITLLVEARKHLNPPNCPWVFPDLQGTQWKLHTLQQRFARLRDRAGLSGKDDNGNRITLYCLRHSRLTEAAVLEGVRLPQLQTMAGHTSTQMTMRYIHPDTEDLHRALEEGRQRRLRLEQQQVQSQQEVPD